MPKRRSNYLRVPIHFVWATHERMPLIPDDGQRRLWRFIEATAQDRRCEVLAVGGMPDHIHLLVNFVNTITIVEFMKQVKGGSSRFVSEQLRQGEWFQWQAHYGAIGVCPGHIDAVIDYINNQKQHHQNKTTQPDWEETFTEYDIPD